MIIVNLTFEASQEIGNTKVELEAKNVKEIIKVGIEQYGKTFSDMTVGNAILVNGRNINHMKGRRTKLKSGDEVSFVTFGAGG